MKRRFLLLAPVMLGLAPAQASIRTHDLAGARLTLDMDIADPALAKLVLDWLTKSAEAIHAYYGRFPVPEVHVHVVPVAGAGVRGGQTFPGELPLIRVRVGRHSVPTDLLEKDWVMVHEMIHLAFPWMNLRHNWMAEGLAVYVESIARVQAGHLPPLQIWRDFVKMMPRGLPHEGDGGFEVSLTHGRTYWGGAMFCLLADIRIRQETGNRFGLQHALRAINAERDFRKLWDFRETLAIGDAATGRTVLMSQFEAMKETPVSPDLDALWRDLGVIDGSGAVNLHATAELSAIRLGIEAPFVKS